MSPEPVTAARAGREPGDEPAPMPGTGRAGADVHASAGGADELETFVRRHVTRVWTYLRECGCDPDTADDVTQEAFLVALRKRFRPRTDSGTRRYLRLAARYALLQHLRRAKRRLEIESEAWLDAVDAEWERRRDAEDERRWLDALRRCRDALTGRRSLAVSLFYRDGLPRAEIARRLAMKESGIKTLLQRVRADLRACIERALA